MLSGFKLTGVVGVGMFVLGMIFGEMNGRDAIYDKWNKVIRKAEEAAETYEDKAEEVEDAQDERVDKGKEEQRAEDMVSRQTYNRLQRSIVNERKYFKDELEKARANPDACNCVNLDMPIGLQRRVSVGEDRNDTKD